MKLRTDKKLLLSLYQAHPKVLCIGIPEPQRNAARLLLPVCLFLPLLKTAEGEWLLGETASSADEELSIPPGNVQCIWTTEPQHAVQSVLEWWRQRGTEMTLPHIVKGDSNALLRDLLLSAWQENCQLIDEKITLGTSLTYLRMQHERLRETCGKLETRLKSSQRDYMEMIFSAQPKDMRVAIPQGKENALVQVLPCDGYGIACVDIYIDDRSALEGTVIINLYGEQGQGALANWQLQGKDLVAGWHQLRLPQALDEHSTNLSLHIYCVPGSVTEQSAPALRLCMTPAARFCLPGAAPEHMLACRLWTGMPSVNYTDQSACGEPVTQGQAGERRAIRLKMPHQTMSHFIDAIPVKVSYTYFQPREKGRLLLHPVKGATTSARLEKMLPAHAINVHIMASIQSARCKVGVNVRMVVAPHGTPSEEVLQGKSILADSGWVTVKHNFHRYLLSAPLPEGVDSSEVSLLLFSQVEGESPPHSAWLEYSELSVDIAL